MLLNDEVTIILDDCRNNDATYRVSLFTASISNSIIECLTFGDFDSSFLNAVSNQQLHHPWIKPCVCF